MIDEKQTLRRFIMDEVEFALRHYREGEQLDVFRLANDVASEVMTRLDRSRIQVIRST